MSDKHISISDSTGVHTFNVSVAPAISFTGAFSCDPDDFDFDEWIRHNPKAVDVILDKIGKAVRSGHASLAADDILFDETHVVDVDFDGCRVQERLKAYHCASERESIVLASLLAGTDWFNIEDGTVIGNYLFDDDPGLSVGERLSPQLVYRDLVVDNKDGMDFVDLIVNGGTSIGYESMGSEYLSEPEDVMRIVRRIADDDKGRWVEGSPETLNPALTARYGFPVDLPALGVEDTGWFEINDEDVTHQPIVVRQRRLFLPSERYELEVLPSPDAQGFDWDLYQGIPAAGEPSYGELGHLTYYSSFDSVAHGHAATEAIAKAAAASAAASLLPVRQTVPSTADTLAALDKAEAKTAGVVPSSRQRHTTR